ncbi:MAG: CvpA family protein [Bacteroidota bacterium]
MSVTDILIIAFLMVSFAVGLRDGLLKKLFAIVGVVLALIVATKYMTWMGEYTIDWFKWEKESAYIISFAFLFLAVVLLTNFFYRWFGGDSKSYKIWDRFAGGLVGMIEGLIVLSLVLILLTLSDIPSKEDKKESTLYNPVAGFAPALFDHINKIFPKSKKFKEELYNAIERYKKLERGIELPGEKK